MQKVDTPLKIWMIGTTVKRFTNSNGNLTWLEYIDMSFCRRRSDLPSSFFLLPKLASLRIDGCSPPEPPDTGSQCLMTSPSPSANHQSAEIKFVKTNYACFIAKESEKDMVEWNESEGAMKHTYHGLGKRSTSVVQLDTTKTHLLAVHEAQIAIYDPPKLECLKQWVPREASSPITHVTYSCDSQSIYISFEDVSLDKESFDDRVS